MHEDPTVDFVFVRDAVRASHCLVSNNPNVVVTSSSEAEFYALTKSASRAPGAVAMVADMAKVVKPLVRVDATASNATASRRGVGRVRHLYSQVLRAQEAVARRELTIAKVAECEKDRRFGTKHLAHWEMHECMRRAGCRTAGGCSRLALRVAQET